MTGRRILKTPAFIKAIFPVDEPIRPAADAFVQFAAEQVQPGQADAAAAGQGVAADEQQLQQPAEQQQLQQPPVAAGGETLGGRPHID